MHLPDLLRLRLADALSELTKFGLTGDVGAYASMIRATNDPKFGDYQVNCAMPLAKQWGTTNAEFSNPRKVAAAIVDALQVGDLCEPAEVAGPGFINLRLKDSYLVDQLRAMLGDPRCLVSKANPARRILVDFSSPNVAKPMHVGHIRSTVIGDALARTLRFLGHETITDNHLGDWGTQFGIIIYGYKHFGDPDLVAKNPVPELSKLYRLVNQLIEYRKAKRSIETAQTDRCAAESEVERLQAESIATSDPKEQKKAKKRLASAQSKLKSLDSKLRSATKKIAAVENDADLRVKAQQHADVDHAVLQETVKLHQGDEQNLRLWEEFLPHCKDEINRIYDALDIGFDHTLGESFYHSMLSEVVEDLKKRGLARDSEGAVCVFLEGFDAPMIIQKKDGAFLYATTDLATLAYRLEEFAPDEILYVVDTRQSEHFEKLFAVAEQIGRDKVKLVHVNFGTVLGEDGRPMKTRSGTLIGLEGLLSDAIDRARQVVCDPERLSRIDPPMDREEQRRVAEAVGLGAIKYADLSHHRTSDYRFSLDKMVSLDGNTSAYIQYSYARTQGILRKAGSSETAVTEIAESIDRFHHPAERALAISLLRLEEALKAVHQDYAPNALVDYLYETAKAYAVFNDNCHVLKADNDAIASLRLALVALCGRVLRLGLDLLGIHVVARM
ncbi:arginine--tRNA ligase [Novipirellula artificiosorum]|uniref:Arginine--tRNA ligase n=1 Tax=Novipirellula artificiosorum TaxID=2528016 RepID=A0A5C6DYF2_9BACT|nr:arginine--tRNA ligase [Novipirellula artificiosorum]TWU41730.1 Arginine--tRNA ligase [Novipirellula artificiosorum]